MAEKTLDLNGLNETHVDTPAFLFQNNETRPNHGFKLLRLFYFEIHILICPTSFTLPAFATLVDFI